MAVDKASDINGAVQSLRASKRPALLELLTSRKQTHPGTVGNSTVKDVIVIPHYDDVLRLEYKFSMTRTIAELIEALYSLQ